MLSVEEIAMSDLEYKVMGLFIDNAKTYVQLSVGALVLSVTFLHDILGIPKDQKIQVPPGLLASWICFLLAVLSGALYQYHAVKYIERESGLGGNASWMRKFDESPYLLYGAMLIGFGLGALLFTVSAYCLM
jgi:hypothetical protein